ncbi:hypothetical protein [Microbacterium sp.]|uniref:hypothetical protein n=1 Tax=Microbacterium sp. TaxID=51671 RepID=UPI003F70C3AD
MSNCRKIRDRGYRTGYLRSPAWFARRDRWFTRQVRSGEALRCQACSILDAKDMLELHHADYTGVHRTPDGHWVAHEPHDHLIPLHPYCHDLLHRLLERDQVLAHHRTRRDATHLALEHLRRKLARPAEEVTNR